MAKAFIKASFSGAKSRLENLIKPTHLMVVAAVLILIAALFQFVITAGSTGAFVMRLIAQNDNKQVLGICRIKLHGCMASTAIAVKCIPRHHADASLGRSYGLGGVGDAGQPNDVMTQTLCAREMAQIIEHAEPAYRKPQGST